LLKLKKNKMSEFKTAAWPKTQGTASPRRKRRGRRNELLRVAGDKPVEKKKKRGG